VATGQVLEFDATVTNLTASIQSVRLDFTVPQYTTYGGLVGGDMTFYDFGTVAAGGSETAKLRFVVVDNPPDGTVISLTVTDEARLVSITKSAVVQSIPTLNLQLSSEQGSVAPGGVFTYTIATANLSASSLPRTKLNVPVPSGSSFVSADGGGILSGGVVKWNFGTLGVGANVQVHATFRASATGAPLGPLTSTVSDSNGHIARASDKRVVYSTPSFQYVLTATPDPVAPGQILEFDATVHNLTAATQSVRLNFTVPQYATYGGLVAGDATFFDFGTVAPGASETAKLRFGVVGSGAIPPDGTSITLNAIDLASGASISRTAVVRSFSPLTLQLSSEQGTVAPGKNFTYTLATANVSGSSLSDVILTAAVPAGASFVSADGGGALSGGIVTWNLGTLGAATNAQVHLTLKVNSGSTPLGPLDAIVSDSNGDIARAGDTRVVYAAPLFQYVLTSTPDPVAPGQILEFDATVHNLTAGTQSVRLDFTVPQYATYGGLVAGDATFFDFGTVALGASETAKLRFGVVGSGSIPPDGTSITLNAIDLARGASISRSAVVRSVSTLNLQLSTEQGTVAPGSEFTYTLATVNVTESSLAGTVLSATVPAGTSFVSADGGGTLNAGVVTWNLGTLAAHANEQLHLTLKANSGSAPLGVLDAVVSDTNGDVARASDIRVVYSAPSFQYILTAIPDPVVPGHVLEYDATVTNLSAGTQSVRLDFTVPQYATYGGLVGGDATFFDFGTVAPAASETAKLRFGVVGSGSVPPDGTSITLKAIDLARGASVSRTAVVQAAPPLNLQLSTQQGTVAPGGNFTYTLAAANVSGSSLRRTILSAAVPAGSSFISADHGGQLTDGVVSWNLRTLGANTNAQVHVTFQASSMPNTPLGPLDAVVSDNAGHVARASDTRVVYAAPLFQYTLTGTPDPVAPGQILEFDATVHNLTAGTQSVRLDFTVPQYTTYGGLVGGDATFFDFGTVAAGGSETAQLLFTVVGSGEVPPDGTSITLDTIDLARGASISRTVVVDSGAK
jgi:uncharacterized repeat protein (TIGR01451 family)